MNFAILCTPHVINISSIMKNKQIIIHVGPAKTGTSALQYFLLKNRDKLEKAGYYYPDHHVDQNGVGGGHAPTCRFNIKNIINNFLESNSKHHTLILSSENFFHMINELNKIYASIKFVSFYRCSIYQSLSGYIQKIKRKNQTDKFKRHKIDRTPNDTHLDNLKIKNINYTIIPYMFDFDNTWSIVNEFLRFIDNSNVLSHMYENKIKIVNPSYCIEAIELKRYINNYINDINIDNNESTMHELDVILQKFTEGVNDFSFLKDEQFEENKKIEILFLEKIIKNYKQPQLKVILNHTQKSKNKKFIKQQLSKQQIVKIVRHIANEDVNILKNILPYISKDPDHPICTEIRNIIE